MPVAVIIPHLFVCAAVSLGADTDFLDTASTPANGFDRPTSGREVRALGHGRVASVKAREVTLHHVFFENHAKRRVAIVFRDLERVDVAEGQDVRRGQPIGRSRGSAGRRISVLDRDDGRALRLQSFLRGRATLFDPTSEAIAIVVNHDAHRMRLYEHGERIAEVEIALGQGAGAKHIRGDNRTPKGMYFVISKYRGAFDGPYGAYYGGHWIKIGYPNAFDARRGERARLIDSKTRRRIERRWRDRKSPPQSTPLGGGIGFHGWAGPWSLADSGRLSWGCIVLHNDDIERLYDRIPIGAMVIIR